jgi:hypothetical protein
MLPPYKRKPDYTITDENHFTLTESKIAPGTAADINFDLSCAPH